MSDLRLISNVFNEYEIYSEKLKAGEGDDWNPNKLLAVLIYKNIFPRDFEKLHQNEGIFARILDHKTQFIAKAEAQYKSEISQIEEKIELAAGQLPADLQELRNIYATALIERLPQFVYQIGVDRSSYIHLCELNKSERFEEFVEATQIFCITAQGGQPEVVISGFQKEVDSVHSFKQRKQIIEYKSDDYQSSALKKINELRDSTSSIRNSKFSELVRRNAREAEKLFEAYGDNAELARFLVFEGHLDDTYYQYTSLFHAGRLSPRDYIFLRQIRDRINPEPDFQIDNPKEVVAEMREGDFDQNHVLNVKIVDWLLGDKSAYSLKIEKLLEFISANFGKCTEFFKAYYATGIAVPQLITGLVTSWSGFIPAAINNTASVQHITNVIMHLSLEELKKLAGKYPNLSEFVAVNLPKILALESTVEPSRLKLLQIKINDLPSIEDYPSISRFLFDEGLYELSIDNIDFIFRSLLNKEEELQNLHKQHYTTILNTGNDALTSRIDGDFGDYLDNVVLGLEDNTQESVPAIVSVINRDKLNVDSIRSFLEQQAALIPSLDEVPDRLHAMVFEIGKIHASWDNCLAFIVSPTHDSHILTNFLNDEETVAPLSKSSVPDSEEASALRQFVIENDGLGDDTYASYVRAFASPVQTFPEEISWKKSRILIEEKKVLFTSENLKFIDADTTIYDLFIEKNIERYLEIESECAPDDEIRERLLSRDISDDQRLRIINLMNIGLLTSMPTRAALLGPILERSGADFSKYDPEAARAIILNARPSQIQISLFNKLHKKFDEHQIRDILSQMLGPFSDIKPGNYGAKIDISSVNLEFVKWLKDRQIISSWSEEKTYFSGDYIRINNKKR